MYYSHQTLVKKGTRELARLDPSVHNVSQWNWEIGKNTWMKDCYGVRFQADISEYEPVYDWFGTPVAGRYKEEGPDLDLLQYVVPEDMRKKIELAEKIKWEEKILEKMKHLEHIRNPFANGSFQHGFKTWFLERRDSRHLYSYMEIWYDGGSHTVNGPQYFIHEGHVWIFDTHMHDLRKAEFNQHFFNFLTKKNHVNKNS